MMRLFQIYMKKIRNNLFKRNVEIKFLFFLIFLKLNWLLLNLNCLNCFHMNLIVYRSFEYKIANRNKITTLFIADRNFDVTQIKCAQKISTRKYSISKVQLDHSTSIGLCKFDLFVLQCSFQKFMPYSPVAIGAHLKPKKFVPFDNLMISKPSKQKRGFVICMSRVMAFEQWQLMIAVLEVYRYLKVDLIVAHVQSMLSVVHELMALYEEDGLLSIRPGVQFPNLKGMPWDPNEETEYNNQVLLAHECFYEHREIAKFIALIDWDDLLIAPKYTTLDAAFTWALRAKPSAAYFLVNKLHCNFIEQKNPQKFNLMLPKLYKQSGICSAIYEGQKMIVRPKKIRSFWIHYSHFVERGSEELLTTNHSLLVHLANSFEVPKDEYKYPFFHHLNVTKIVANFEGNIWRKMQHAQLTSKLSLRKLYYKIYEKCHNDIVSYYKSLNPELCINYNICTIPRIKADCTSVESKFRSKCTIVNGWRKFGIHIRKKTNFVKRENGC